MSLYALRTYRESCWTYTVAGEVVAGEMVAGEAVAGEAVAGGWHATCRSTLES